MSYQILDTRKLHEEYAAADRETQATVDAAYDAVRETLIGRNRCVSNTDAAEVLVAAIYSYLRKSEEETVTRRVANLKGFDLNTRLRASVKVQRFISCQVCGKPVTNDHEATTGICFNCEEGTICL